jgi:hypothetical protein
LTEEEARYAMDVNIEPAQARAVYADSRVQISAFGGGFFLIDYWVCWGSGMHTERRIGKMQLSKATNPS